MADTESQLVEKFKQWAHGPDTALRNLAVALLLSAIATPCLRACFRACGSGGSREFQYAIKFDMLASSNRAPAAYFL